MKKKPTYYIGTSGWNYPDWQGIFYPTAWPKRRWLEYYATQFRTVEINATFYRFFNDKTYIKWHDEVPQDFRFVLKAPQLITHRKLLHDCDDTIKRFCHSASLLNNKFGLILLQLSPRVPYDLKRLKHALRAFDDPKKVAVEFRHQQWLTAETKALLADLGCVFCSTDSPESTLLDWVTSDTAYIRLHGHKEWYDYHYSKKELNNIAVIAKRMAHQGAKTIYIFFNNDYAGYAAKNAIYLRDLLS